MRKLLRQPLLCLMIGASATAASAAGTPTSGDLTYTRYFGLTGVSHIPYSFDGTTFELGTIEDIAPLPGADGVIFAPDGDIIVGGGGALDVYKVHRGKIETTVQTRAAGNSGAFHLALDPDKKRVWAGSLPGALLEISLNPFSDGLVRVLSGDDDEVTGIAFDPDHTAYYTKSTQLGVGNFGVIDLKTYTTVRTLTSLPAAHGIVYDTFTGDLILTGEKHITQIDRATKAIVSDLDLSANPALNTGNPGIDLLDQGTTDGEGHLFVGANNGYMFFIDMSKSKTVASQDNVVTAVFLDSYVDDVAPISWLGAPKLPNDPKSPGSLNSPASTR